MSRNIKEIGKELMGKSLNSFHRKTGLTQLEKNNEIQDGILDGILSQVDDAYIEKTEQSNVIHLEGSGDGVVVLDSIEGNTMVNMVKSYNTNDFVYSNAIMQSDGYFKIQYGRDVNASYVRPKLGIHTYKPNTQYTVIVDIKENTCGKKLGMSAIQSAIQTLSPRDFQNTLGISTSLITTRSDINIDDKGNPTRYDLYFGIWEEDGGDLSKHITFRYWILEGDWRNKELPPYFTGLQSSFEEKVNDEGKYEIEILSKNKNLLGNNNKDLENWIDGTYLSKKILLKPNTKYTTYAKKKKTPTSHCVLNISRVPYTGDNVSNSPRLYTEIFNVKGESIETERTRVFTTDNTGVCYLQYYENGHRKYNNNIDLSQWFDEICDVTISEGDNTLLKHIEPKQNKIKLLINELLRSGVTKKDNLCVIDNKLYIERNTKQLIFDGSRNWLISNGHENICHARLPQSVIGKDIDLTAQNSKIKGYCDKLSLLEHGIWNQDIEGIHTNNSPNFDNRALFINIKRTTVGGNTSEILKTYLSNNPIKLVIETYEPVYEEVVNEYGEPIILEGYENGTLYIDSTVLPTTTVRYTPKMESFKTLKEVNKNNNLTTLDINDNIIPYMMDVDYMIMEKELLLLGTLDAYRIKNNRRIGENDMTSMQKRTGEMLERLFRGKSLTEQEARERVIIYLEANKITAEQANYLNEVILEVYA